MKVVYDFRMTQVARATKVACNNVLPSKSVSLNLLRVIILRNIKQPSFAFFQMNILHAGFANKEIVTRQ